MTMLTGLNDDAYRAPIFNSNKSQQEPTTAASGRFGVSANERKQAKKTVNL